MDLKPGFLEKMLRARGFNNLIIVPERKRHEIAPGIRVEVFPASHGHICANVIDSSVIFDFGDFVLLNCNDNKPSEELCRYIRDAYSRIDLAFLPAGGGSGYPAMYTNLSANEKREITRQAIQRYTDGFTTAVDLLRPKVAVPVAGGYAIRGPRAEEVNWYQARRFNQMEIVDHYKSHGTSKETVLLPLQSGMELDADQGVITKGEYHVWTDDELRSHFTKLASETVEPKIKTRSQLRGLETLFDMARKNLWVRQQQQKMFPEYTIYFEIAGRDRIFEVRLDRPETRTLKLDEPRIEPYLTMQFDHDTALEWLLGYEDFNMLDSGHRILFTRRPNIYVVEAYYLMSLFRLI
jgi:hypothetical protein